MRAMPAGRKLIVENRRARHDYLIAERVEAGVVLTGTEVKSLRDGGGNLRDAYAQLREGELWLVGANIAPYRQGNIQNHEPLRDRKLLLHRREIEKLGSQVAERGMTLVPLAMYFTNGRVKLELGLGRGKEKADRRQALAERDARRQIDRALRERERGGGVRR
jgi:SsrA-binding protein